MFSFQHIVCSKNNLSWEPRADGSRFGQVFFQNFLCYLNVFFILLLLAECRHIFTLTITTSTLHNFIATTFLLVCPCQKQRTVSNKINLAFWICFRRKKKPSQRNKAMKSSFSDMHSPVHVEGEQRFSKANEIRAFHFSLWHTSVKWTCSTFDLKCFPCLRLKRYNKYLISLVFSVRTVSYGSSFLPLDLWPVRFALGP